MTKDKNPLSPILIRFKQDLQFNDLEERSQESYCRAVRKFSEFLKREPDTASEDDLRNYLLFIKNDLNWAASTINVAQQSTRELPNYLPNYGPSILMVPWSITKFCF